MGITKKPLALFWLSGFFCLAVVSYPTTSFALNTKETPSSWHSIASTDLMYFQTMNKRIR